MTRQEQLDTLQAALEREDDGLANLTTTDPVVRAAADLRPSFQRVRILSDLVRDAGVGEVACLVGAALSAYQVVARVQGQTTEELLADGGLAAANLPPGWDPLGG